MSTLHEQKKTVMMWSALSDRGADAGVVRRAMENLAGSGAGAMEFARRNRVLPQVFANIRGHGLEGDTPPAVLEQLQQASRAAAAYNMLLLDTGDALQRAAAQGGPELLPFKGLSLLGRELYGPGERQMSDLDFIVRGDALEDLDRLMESLEWRLEPAPLPREFEDEFSGERKYTKTAGGARMDAEFRWIPSPGPALGRAFPLDPETAWRLSSVSGDGRVLTPEAELLFCIHHLVALHSFGRLMWFLDVKYLADEYRDEMDWDLLWEELAAAGLRRGAVAVFAFLRDYMVMESVPGMRSAAVGGAEGALLERLILDSLCGGRMKVSGAIPGLVADKRHEYFTGYLFPGNRYLRMRYPGVPAPLLPFHRAVRIVWKAVTGKRSS